MVCNRVCSRWLKVSLKLNGTESIEWFHWCLENFLTANSSINLIHASSLPQLNQYYWLNTHIGLRSRRQLIIGLTRPVHWSLSVFGIGQIGLRHWLKHFVLSYSLQSKSNLSIFNWNNYRTEIFSRTQSPDSIACQSLSQLANRSQAIHSDICLLQIFRGGILLSSKFSSWKR